MESDEHRKSLTGASLQHERASVAAHRLLRLLRPGIADPRGWAKGARLIASETFQCASP